MRNILLIFLSFTIAHCSSPEVEKPIPIRPVKYMTVTKSNLLDKHTYSGTASAKEQANLSFRVAGTVNNIFVKIGDRINAGQVIATLDPADYDVQLKQLLAVERGAQANEKSAETQIKSAEANYIAARSAYNRIAKLYENNSVSLSQFEQAKAQYEAGEASFTAAKSQYEAAKFNTNASKEQIRSAQNQVSYTRLKAPFSGVISIQHIEENELVNSGTPIVTLSSLGETEIVVGVPEMLISRIKKDMPTKVRFTTIENKLFDGKVLEVGYSPNNSATYPVTIDLLSSDESIRPGMPVDVSFLFNPQNQELNKIIVPASAVGEDQNGPFVFVLEKNENKATAKKQYINIGSLRNEGFEVLSGLSEGQLIATAGLNILLEGDVVRLN